MKCQPEILYAKYHFVRRVGRHLKIKKECVQKWSKMFSANKMVFFPIMYIDVIIFFFQFVILQVFCDTCTV